ncbi:hypothetical protein IFM12276_31900 [Nocardia sputorum]|uniref:Uncharacterized protein n=1 Tax=Nocardia sputorum TaxID=2984338 RepID=A0ABN6U4K5_9NOCA|nr:hypothetical protein IFM12276_31900 [Nocardia sputorum]
MASRTHPDEIAERRGNGTPDGLPVLRLQLGRDVVAAGLRQRFGGSSIRVLGVSRDLYLRVVPFQGNRDCFDDGIGAVRDGGAASQAE